MSVGVVPSVLSATCIVPFTAMHPTIKCVSKLLGDQIIMGLAGNLYTDTQPLILIYQISEIGKRITLIMMNYNYRGIEHYSILTLIHTEKER